MNAELRLLIVERSAAPVRSFSTADEHGNEFITFGNGNRYLTALSQLFPLDNLEPDHRLSKFQSEPIDRQYDFQPWSSAMTPPRRQSVQRNQ